MDGFCDKIYLKSNVIWFVALESIIHVLFVTGVEIFKALPLLLATSTNADA